MATRDTPKKNITLSRFKQKENNYQKMINSFLLNKYLALSPMNYLDIEYERLKNEEKEKKIIKQMTKKKFRISNNIAVKSVNNTTIIKGKVKLNECCESLNPNILQVPGSEHRVNNYCRTNSN